MEAIGEAMNERERGGGGGDGGGEEERERGGEDDVGEEANGNGSATERCGVVEVSESKQ